MRKEFRADITTVYYIVTLDIRGYVKYRQENIIEIIKKAEETLFFNFIYLLYIICVLKFVVYSLNFSSMFPLYVSFPLF